MATKEEILQDNTLLQEKLKFQEEEIVKIKTQLEQIKTLYDKKITAEEAEVSFEEIKKFHQEISNSIQEYEDKVKDLNDSDQETFARKKFQKLGLDYNKVKKTREKWNQQVAAGLTPDPIIPSNVFPNLPMIIYQQALLGINGIDNKEAYVEFKIQNLEILKNGNKTIFAQDFKEGESILNHDGGATVSRLPEGDVIIDDFNSTEAPRVSYVKKVDYSWSLKYSIFYAALNDISPSDGFFNAVMNNLIFKLTMPLIQRMRQRAWLFVDQSVDDQTFNYVSDKDITTIYEDSNVKAIALQMIRDIKVWIKKMKNPSRNWKLAAKYTNVGLPQPLMWKLADKLTLFVDVDFWTYIQTDLFANVFNEEWLFIKDNVEIIEYKFNIATEIYDFKVRTDIATKTLFYGIATNTYKETLFYNINVAVQTTRGRVIHNTYSYGGQYEQLEGFIMSGQIVASTPSLLNKINNNFHINNYKNYANMTKQIDSALGIKPTKIKVSPTVVSSDV